MTCDEFRRRWLDENPESGSLTPEAGRGDAATRRRGELDVFPASAGGCAEEAPWDAHRGSCPSCAAWEARQRALDDALATALLVAPLPELSARLTRISPPAADSATESVEQRLLGLAFLIVATLGAIGLSGASFALVLGLLWPVAVDALQTVPLILYSPLVGYYQSIAFTLLEALATLVLAAMILLPVRPGAPGATPTSRS